MQPSRVREIARRFNGGRERGSAAALGRAMGVPAKTARAWMTDESDEVNHRRMSRTATRLASLLAMLDAAGIANEEFLASLESFEGLLRGPPRRLRALVASLREDGDDAESD